MKISRTNIFITVIAVIFVLSLITNWNYFLVIALNVTLTAMLLDKLGKGIVLRELMALHGCFICLLMPLVGYVYYDNTYFLSRLWVKYMSIPQETYFGFCLPAMAGYSLAICWPSTKPNVSDTDLVIQNLMRRSKEVLEKIPMRGIYIMLIGLISFMFSELLPVVVQFVFSLFFFASFAGFLYVYFTKNLKRRTILLWVFALIIFGNAIQSGMFTIVAYMGITMVSYFFVGRKLNFLSKSIAFVVGILLIFAIQTVKLSYRQQTWLGQYNGSKAGLFLSLLQDQITGSSKQDLQEAFFPIYVRGNQGINIVSVMHRIPQYQDFDGGKTLFTTMLSSFVPRVFWPDKPEAGGKFNMKYYAGYVIDGWSTNIGPLGEAYGSFGTKGGIVFMIFLGWFIRWSYFFMFRLSIKIPLLLFWIPVIFYQVTYSAESDTLQVLNSIIKSSFFVWMVFKFRPDWFGIFTTPFSRTGEQSATKNQLNANSKYSPLTVQ